MRFIALILLGLASLSCHAEEREWRLSVGGGPQAHTNDNHRSFGLDYQFYEVLRTPRHYLEIGSGVTYIESNDSRHDSLWAISVYPQINASLPNVGGLKPQFFARALGLTWLSSRYLGEREQASRLTLQAQIGVSVPLDDKTQISLSWKHFSNANLASPNDGFDLPLLLTLSHRF